MKTPFLGQAYVARSTNLADNHLINLYPEMAPAAEGEAKDVAGFFGTPGLDLLTTVGTGPVRGATPSADGSTLYVVSGNKVYSLTTAFVATPLGAIDTNTDPVSIIVNPTQAAIFDAISGYSISSGALAQIALPFSGPVSAQYQDGFGLVNQLGTSNWWQSSLFDFTTWDPLNFSIADSKPDSLVALGDLNREVFLFKEKETEIWINAGNAGFSFQRLDGAYVEVGCAASFSVTKCGQTIAWLGRGKEGEGVVYMLNGYQAVPISTAAIETAIATYPTISDAIGYSYLQEGHLFYVLTFPSGNATWVFDFKSKLWHQRAAFANGMFSRHQSNCYAKFSGKFVVGDYQNGNIYNLNLNTYTDAGLPRKWVRSWRALPKPSFVPVTFSSLQIDMQTGINVPPGTNPQCVLRWTDDGGHNYSSEKFGAVGKTGETAKRVKFNRLGSTKFNAGLDRVFELSSTDQFQVALIGADLQ